jgi:hypothetical protein
MSVSVHYSLKSVNGRWILLATTLASASSFLAGSALPVALPSIQSYFNTTLSGLQWIVNANLLALGALILIGGALGDHFGRKQVFIIVDNSDNTAGTSRCRCCSHGTSEPGYY